MKPIAYVKAPFGSKFGIPRQSGTDSISAEIVFEKEYSAPEAVRGLEEYSHIWVIWQFSEVPEDHRSLTVRPPRLGGNKRVGVFATRSPFRPNRIGLSSVRLTGISRKNGRTVLSVTGSDMLDGTPVFDVKPYLPYTDSHTDAVGGFADDVLSDDVEVIFPDELKKQLSAEMLKTVCDILSQNPKPHYQSDEERVYGFEYGGYEIKFNSAPGIITVCGVESVSCDTEIR